jgi:membrane associated rhomboid family serine protease
VIIGLNVAVYVVQLFLARSNPERYEEFLRTLWVWGVDFKPWTLVTSAFLHADSHPWHILGNILFLWVFGPNIEDRFGRVGFSLFYLMGAAASGGVHAVLSNNPAIGASGAVAACTGAYLVMFPQTQVKCFSMLGYIGVVRVSAWWFIVLAITWDIVLQSSGARTGIAHAAHLGGTVFGIAVSMTLLWLKVLPREPFDLFTMGRQAMRRRQLKEAALQTSEENKQRWERARTGAAEEIDAISGARAEVVRLVIAGEMPAAAAAYRALADRFGDKPGAVTLSRRYQYDLANFLYAEGKYADAAYAYEKLLEAYPKDPEAPQVRLLLGRICARELNDPVRAKQLITEAAAKLDGDALRTWADPGT